MKRILIAAVLAATVGAAPTALSAKSKAYNSVQGKVEVYWTALGCAGAKITCTGRIEGFICKNKTLKTGESGSYSFNDGSSARSLVVYHCANQTGSSDNTGNKGSKKRCAAITDVNNMFDAKCGYSEEEYKELKDQEPTTVEYPILGQRKSGKRRSRD